MSHLAYKLDTVSALKKLIIYSAIKKKKNEMMPFAATWINLAIIILSEVNHKEKDKYYMISLICRIQNTTQMNLPMKQAHRHREQTFGYQGGGG